MLERTSPKENQCIFSLSIESLYMIRELRTFVAVVQDGTFAAAGDRIGLTQAAVSAQIQRLESELGFQVFDRTGRAARLNPKGHQLFAQAQELLRLYGHLGSSRASAGAPLLVSVGAIASVQRALLPDVLARFHRQQPQARTRIVPGVSMQLLDLVDSGKLDLAVVIRPPFALQRDLHWTTLAEEPFRLLVPRSVRGDDWAELLRTQPFIRYDRVSFGGRQVERFLRAARIEVRDVCEADELEAIVRLVANGVGVALLPQTLTHRRWPAAVRAIDLGKHTFHRDIGLVHRAAPAAGEPVLGLARMIVDAYQRVLMARSSS
jgi:DNA-binding transcriptional LysR family regulator